ncbi:MAG: hypothetical protein NVS9B15_06900 [Acidobacteriaceae bacterium]
MLVFRERLADLAVQNQSFEYFALCVSLILLLLQARRATSSPVRWPGVVLAGAALAALVGLNAWKRPIVSSTPMLMATCTLGMVWALFGSREARRQLFPSAYLLLMTPLPVFIVVVIDLPLQVMSAALASNVAGFLGIATERSGTVIGLHGTEISLRIIGDCGGLHSAYAMVAVTVLLGWLLQASFRKHVALVFAGIAVAYAANILRLTTMIALLNRFGQAFVAKLPAFESWFGASLFALCVTVVYFLARRMGCKQFRDL